MVQGGTAGCGEKSFSAGSSAGCRPTGQPEAAPKVTGKRGRPRRPQITAKAISVEAEGPLCPGDAGNRSKSGRINDLAAAARTDLNHIGWWKRGRISVLSSVLATARREPRDRAGNSIYTGGESKWKEGIERESCCQKAPEGKEGKKPHIH